jgi:hypothetical protein
MYSRPVVSKPVNEIVFKVRACRAINIIAMRAVRGVTDVQMRERRGTKASVTDQVVEGRARLCGGLDVA